MPDVEKIVTALRRCADWDTVCTKRGECPYFEQNTDDRLCWDVLLLEAAEMLEAQAARLKELEGRTDDAES